MRGLTPKSAPPAGIVENLETPCPTSTSADRAGPAGARAAAASIGRVAVAKPQDYLADLNPAQREAVLTTEAAGEMRDRLEGLLGNVARAIWILTFHAACGRILRREAPRLGYKSNF